MEMKNTRSKSSQRVLEMVQIALMIAVTYLAASYLNIPNGYGGVVQFGDTVIFVTAIIFGTRQAVISGALAMTMFDAFSPYAVYAPYTFVIKAVMALLVGVLANSGRANGDKWIRNVIGIVLAGTWGVAGYFGAEIIIYKSLAAAVPGLLGNSIQAIVSGAMAAVLAAALKKTKYFGGR